MTSTLNRFLKFSLTLAAGFVVIAAAKPASAAVSAFIAIDGVIGNSNDTTFKNQTEIRSYSFGMTAPSNGAGTSQHAPKFSTLTFTQSTDSTSTVLFDKVTGSATTPTVTLSLRKAGTNGEYCIVTLSEVVLTSLDTVIAGDSLVDTVKLAFSRIKIEYKKFDSAGKVITPGTITGWDVVKNTTF